jgi:hypothetical protein
VVDHLGNVGIIASERDTHEGKVMDKKQMDVATHRRHYDLLILASHGSPDFGESPNEEIAPGRRCIVSTLVEASNVCLEYIAEWGLGGGHWGDGAFVMGASGVVGAIVSYNGRVWPPVAWAPGVEPLYSPAGRTWE